jgi:hypothetical protein
MLGFRCDVVGEIKLHISNPYFFVIGFKVNSTDGFAEATPRRQFPIPHPAIQNPKWYQVMLRNISPTGSLRQPNLQARAKHY